MSMAVTRTQSRVWVADFSFPQFVGKKWQLLSLTNLSWTGQHIIPKDNSNSPPSSERNWCTAGLSYSLTFLLSFIWATDIIPLNMDSTSTFTGLPAKAFPPHSLQTILFSREQEMGGKEKEETGRRDACSCLQNQFEQRFICSPFPLCCIPSISLKLWLMSKPNKLSQKAAPAAEPLLCYQVAEFSSPHGHPHNSRRNHNLPFQFISCQSKPKACIKMLYSRFPHTGNPISSRGSCFTSSWVKTSMAAADNWLVQSQLEEKGLWLNQATQNTEAGQLSEKFGLIWKMKLILSLRDREFSWWQSIAKGITRAWFKSCVHLLNIRASPNPHHGSFITMYTPFLSQAQILVSLEETPKQSRKYCPSIETAQSYTKFQLKQHGNQ